MNPSSVNPSDFSVRGFFNAANPWTGSFSCEGQEKIDVIDAPDLLNQSWEMTVKIFPDRVNGQNVPLNGTLLSQIEGGQGIEIKFDDNEPKLVIHGSENETVYPFNTRIKCHSVIS